MGKQKTSTIKREEDFSLLFKNGVKWESSVLNVYSLKNKLEYNRQIIFVAKKNGTAVKRNKIKRIARGFFNKNRGITPSHYDVLIKFHPKRLKIKTGEVEGILKEWYTNIGK